MLSDAAAAVQSTSDTAGGAAKDDGGFFGPLASLFESILKVGVLADSALERDSL